MTESPALKKHRWPVYVVIALLVVFSASFVLILAATTESEMSATAISSETLTANTYKTEVEAVLEGADAANGAILVEKYGCIACHRGDAVAKIAPPFTGIAERAETRRPPLPANAYIYESITNPTAYVVPEYSPVMPLNYPDQLSKQDLGDIISFLLTAEAH